MKNMRLLKAIKILGTCLAFGATFVMTVSCNGLMNSDSSKKSTQDKIILHLNIRDVKRTVLPSAKAEDLTDFELYGIETGYNYSSWADFENNFPDDIELIGSFADYDELQSATIELNPAKKNTRWWFYLSAKSGTNGAEFGAMCTEKIELQLGNNEISFNLSLIELGSASVKGSLNYTLDYSADTVNAARVTKAVVKLYLIDSDGGNSAEPVLQRIYGVGGTEQLSQNKITVVSENLDAGSYRVYIDFFTGTQGNLPVAKWREIIQIASNLTSKKTVNINNLTNIYLVTYVFNDNATANRTESVIAASELLEPTRSGWLFVNWYKDSALTQPFAISEIKEDTTVYAKWIDSSNPHIATKTTVAEKIAAVVAADTSISDPFEIKVLGGVENETFDEIQTALLNNSSAFIALDFSEATEITQLPSGCFRYTNIVNVTLPESLKIINDGAFENCYKITGITIPASVEYIAENAFVNEPEQTGFTVAEGNEYFKAVDGVLYSYDGSVLVSYPSGKVATSYTTPASVTRIKRYAFNYTKTPVINITNNVNVLERDAFWSCNDIDSINLADTQSVWYGGSYSTPEEAFQNGEPYYSILYIIDKWKNGDWYISTTLWKKSGETFADHVTDVTGAVIAPTESRDLTDSESRYNIVVLDNTSSYKWLCLSTVQGQLYKILTCVSGTSSQFTTGDLEEENFASLYMDLYDGTGNRIDFNSYNPDGDSYYEEFTFVAQDNTTYIRFSIDNGDADKYLALQITAPSMTANPVSVTLGQNDDLSEIYNTDDLIYESSNTQYYFGWNISFGENTQKLVYVDGELQSDNWCVNFGSDDKGPHILMLEVVIDGKRYSYSKQVIVE